MRMTFGQLIPISPDNLQEYQAASCYRTPGVKSDHTYGILPMSSQARQLLKTEVVKATGQHHEALDQFYRLADELGPGMVNSEENQSPDTLFGKLKQLGVPFDTLREITKTFGNLEAQVFAALAQQPNDLPAV